MSIADLLLMYAQTTGEKIGCFREVQNSIEDSVHALLKEEIQRLKLDGFDTTQNAIRHAGGGEFRFRGLARNPDSIKSMHGFQKFWIEEAQSISQESLDKLTPTLREAGSEAWFSLNPGSAADPISKRFLLPFQDELERNGYYEDDIHLIIRVNYSDNPFFPASLEQERLWDYDNKSRAAYDHTWLGAFNDDVEDAIIRAEWFDACIDAHLKIKGWKPRGIRVCSHDPSDMGGDPKGIAFRHGTIVTHVDERGHGDVNEGADWATDYAIEHDADMFVYDEDGLGASLRRQINTALSGKRMRIEGFKGSQGVDRPNEQYQERGEFTDESKPRTNKETFKNKRAQKYWGLRDRFYLTYRCIVHGDHNDPDDMISISSNVPNIGKLRSEICRIPRKPNGSGFIQIMTKDEMKTKHKIVSPNMSDSVYMLWGIDPVKERPRAAKMNFRKAV